MKDGSLLVGGDAVLHEPRVENAGDMSDAHQLLNKYHDELWKIGLNLSNEKKKFESRSPEFLKIIQATNAISDCCLTISKLT